MDGLVNSGGGGGGGGVVFGGPGGGGGTVGGGPGGGGGPVGGGPGGGGGPVGDGPGGGGGPMGGGPGGGGGQVGGGPEGGGGVNEELAGCTLGGRSSCFFAEEGSAGSGFVERCRLGAGGGSDWGPDEIGGCVGGGGGGGGDKTDGSGWTVEGFVGRGGCGFTLAGAGDERLLSWDVRGRGGVRGGGRGTWELGLADTVGSCEVSFGGVGVRATGGGGSSFVLVGTGDGRLLFWDRGGGGGGGGGIDELGLDGTKGRGLVDDCVLGEGSIGGVRTGVTGGEGSGLDDEETGVLDPFLSNLAATAPRLAEKLLDRGEGVVGVVAVGFGGGVGGSVGAGTASDASSSAAKIVSFLSRGLEGVTKGGGRGVPGMLDGGSVGFIAAGLEAEVELLKPGGGDKNGVLVNGENFLFGDSFLNTSVFGGG